MKYIRTEDGRILQLDEFKYKKKYHWYIPNEKYLNRLGLHFSCWMWCFDDEYDSIPNVVGKMVVQKIKREECKFADTIEELCDEFVGISNGKPQMLRFIPYDCAQYWNDGIYGAIWTDEGLIYVAKMNGERKFELYEKNSVAFN